jgi:hypothetical protein
MKLESGVKKSRRIWSKEDIQLLHNTIDKYPDNNQKAYREVAQLTNRNVKSVEMYYYMNIKDKNYNTVINNKQKREAYRKEEQDIIKKNIKLYPHNLQYAFEKSAEELPNRSKSSIANIYYYKMKKDNTIITVGSEKGFTKDNTKNQHKSKKTGEVAADLQPIQWLIKELLNLSIKERNFIATFLTDTNKLLS